MAAEARGDGRGRAGARSGAGQGRVAREEPAEAKPGGKQGKKKEPPDPLADASPLGLLKREAAERLGLLKKVKRVGWAGQATGTPGGASRRANGAPARGRGTIAAVSARGCPGSQ